MRGKTNSRLQEHCGAVVSTWLFNKTINHRSQSNRLNQTCLEAIKSNSSELTTWTLHLSGGLLSTSSDCRKVNMAAGEWVQQLTSSRTSTPLVQAAARRAESMTGQNLRRDRRSEHTKVWPDWWPAVTPPARPPRPNLVSPDWLRELWGGQEVHDGDEDKLAGVVDDGQDGGEVVCAPAGRDLRGGALREAPETWTNQRGGVGEVRRWD